MKIVIRGHQAVTTSEIPTQRGDDEKVHPGELEEIKTQKDLQIQAKHLFLRNLVSCRIRICKVASIPLKVAQEQKLKSHGLSVKLSYFYYKKYPK